MQTASTHLEAIENRPESLTSITANNGGDHHHHAPRARLRENTPTEMCSGSEAGSYLRLITFVYHSTLGMRVIKKKKTTPTPAQITPRRTLQQPYA